MILLIPYTRFTIKAYLQAHEVEQRLAAEVEPRQLFRWGFSRDHKFFAGTVENGKFNINRIIHYRNNFLPIITGQIHNDLNTSRIEVTTRLSYFIIGFMALFIPFWAFISFGFLVSPETGNGGAGSFTLFFSFLILFYGISMVFYNYEVNKARRYLEEIFQAGGSNPI